MREKIVTILNRCAIVICSVALLIAIYLMSQDAGLIDGTFGPGSYYYSDIPGWEKIFLSDKTLHFLPSRSTSQQNKCLQCKISP